MTHTARYTQAIDQDFPLTVEWDIEYRVVAGCPGDRLEPAGDDELEIVSQDITAIVVWLTDDLGADARLYDLEWSQQKRVRDRLAKLLDRELLLEVCERHWERIGREEELEAA